MTDELPAWERRFRAPTLSFPAWNRHAPTRLVVASTESGSYQVHAWDAETGARRRLSDEPVGVTHGDPTADGERVVWFRDSSGDESGGFVVGRFDGHGDVRPLHAELPAGWPQGIAIGRERTIVGLSNRDGFGVWGLEADRPPRLLRRHRESVVLGGGGALAGGGQDLGALSADETLLCVEHAEHGDLIHTALRILDATTGAVLADLHDPNRALLSFAWSPAPGEQRLAIGHERRGEVFPAIWDVRTGIVEDLAIDLDGVVEVADWWPDASALLIVQLVDGRHRLHRFEAASGVRSVLPTEPGSITGARVRPDGTVWYRVQSGEAPVRLLQAGVPGATAAAGAGPAAAAGASHPLLTVEGAPAPAGHPFHDWSFTNPHGQQVHGFLVEPAGEPPWPLVMQVHGGPTSVDLDRWSPDIAALVDSGFLVAMVNYRGSVGFGAAWRDTLIGNIGWPEVEDIAAGHDDLIARGLADPDRSVIAGASWGGYLTLLMHGMHPDRFRAGIAGVPVGDYAMGYDELSPMLQAYDRALLGGTPAEVPQFMAERSPIMYVDRVRAPILFLIGRHDSRCPYRQAIVYVERLRDRGHPHALHVYDTGHSSYDLDERVRQRAIGLDFLARVVPGIGRLPRVAELAGRSGVEQVGLDGG